jgi:myosin-crossreactive antigen
MTKSWLKIAPLCKARSQHFSFCTSTHVYVIGGQLDSFQPATTIERLPLRQGSHGCQPVWEEMPYTLAAGSENGVIMVDGKFMILGGRRGRNHVSNVTLWLDPEAVNPVWRFGPPLPQGMAMVF